MFIRELVLTHILLLPSYGFPHLEGQTHALTMHQISLVPISSAKTQQARFHER